MSRLFFLAIWKKISYFVEYDLLFRAFVYFLFIQTFFSSYRTAKVWDTSNFQLKYTLEGHEQAVWAVLALDGEDDLVLTGKISPLFFFRYLLKTYLIY